MCLPCKPSCDRAGKQKSRRASACRRRCGCCRDQDKKKKSRLGSVSAKSQAVPIHLGSARLLACYGRGHCTFPVCLSNLSRSSDFARAKIGVKTLRMINGLNTQRGWSLNVVLCRCSVFFFRSKILRLVLCSS